MNSTHNNTKNNNTTLLYIFFIIRLLKSKSVFFQVILVTKLLAFFSFLAIFVFFKSWPLFIFEQFLLDEHLF
jgi:hypothetical protein